MLPCIIVDIDGTLADVERRRHHLPDWPKFFADMRNDPPITPVIELVNALILSQRYDVVLASGRPEDYRADTEAWLDTHRVSWDALYMRKAGDRRSDVIVKREMLAEIRKQWNVSFVIDDRQSVVDMWRSEGLVCLQAAPGDFDTAPTTTTTTPTGHLILTVGPSGSGKSTMARALAEQLGALVLSSDQFRHNLLSDPNDQTQNSRVFDALHKTAAAALAQGLRVIIDATHLRRKERMRAAMLAPKVEYVVIDRPLEDALASKGHRSERVIRTHYHIFESQRKDIQRGDGLPHVTVRTPALAPLVMIPPHLLETA